MGLRESHQVRYEYIVASTGMQGARRGIGGFASAVGEATRKMSDLASRTFSFYNFARLIGGAYSLKAIVQSTAAAAGHLVTMKIGMAGLLQQMSGGRGVLADFDNSWKVATYGIQKMRSIAAVSIGTAEDYREAFNNVAFAARAAGASIDKTITLTRHIVAVEKASGLMAGVVSRDVRQLMLGVFSMAQIQTPQLKAVGKQVVDMIRGGDRAGALSLIEQSLTMSPEALTRFGKSYDAMFDTLKDRWLQARERFGVAAAPKFKQAFDNMSKSLVQWFDKAAVFGEEFARWTVAAFDKIVEFSKYVYNHWDDIVELAKKFFWLWIEFKGVTILASMAASMIDIVKYGREFSSIMGKVKFGAGAGKHALPIMATAAASPFAYAFGEWLASTFNSKTEWSDKWNVSGVDGSVSDEKELMQQMGAAASLDIKKRSRILGIAAVLARSWEADWLGEVPVGDKKWGYSQKHTHDVGLMKSVWDSRDKMDPKKMLRSMREEYGEGRYQIWKHQAEDMLRRDPTLTPEAVEGQFLANLDALSMENQAVEEAKNGAAHGKFVVDMRYSIFEVKQEFTRQAPDEIAVAFVDEITREPLRRLKSVYNAVGG